MDIVLELADTFIFDPLYATLLPAAQPSTSFAANATFSSIREEPTSYAVPHTTWQYAPATKYFSIEPSKYAYMSTLSRDDWRRQAITLYLITWYTLPSYVLSTQTDAPTAGFSASSYTMSLQAHPTSSSSIRQPSSTRDTSRTR